MVEAVILIGLQASGKSTFCRVRFFRTHVRINYDMLKTRHRERNLLTCCLDLEQSLVVDNTNPTRYDRARYLPAAAAAGFHTVGYFFEPDVRLSLRRNAERTADERIPDVGIYATAKKLEPPSHDEGFEELHLVRVAENGSFVIEPIGAAARTAGGDNGSNDAKEDAS